MKRNRNAGWTIALLACIMGTFAFSAADPTANAKGHARIQQDTEVTTQSGVFSVEQASRGKNTFAGICLSCHVPSSQSGDAFDQHWKDHSLSDLYVYVVQQMPQDNPGSLDSNTAVDVVAYILQLNAMPAGTADLAPDSVALKKIRITRTKGPTP